MSAENLYVVLTVFGTFLCRDRKSCQFVHRRLDDIGEDAELAQFQADATTLRPTTGAPELFAIVNPGGGRTVHLQCNELFLCADLDGNAHVSRVTANPWETFLLMSVRELEEIRFIAANDWLCRSGGQRVAKESIGLAPDFQLSFGDFRIDLGDNLPIPCRPASTGSAPFNRFSLWVDGWRLVDFLLHRPLVYYCAFGGKSTFELLRHSLVSLHCLADYRGDVLVIGDRDKDYVAAYVPKALRDRLHVWNVTGGDFLDYCAARYLLPLWPQAAGFQPFLYVDTDIAFDQELQGFLLSLALSPRMAAQRETFSPLATSESVGAPLFREANIATGDECGFNSGIIGIPSLDRHKETLLRIRETMYRYARAKGDRRALSHFDQAIANYVAFTTAGIDLDLVSDRTRWMDNDVIYGGDIPIGFVHFWGTIRKPEQMSRYINRLMGEHVPEQAAK
ncbi:hypothetical protein [Roseomonas genomospecies 6]|uniref:Uncharacterized protein n=1 Tax=Roseomonas genomospecies 6 TaxID=214106 RepID=A0A9W7NGT8_9PROT|nr:hypothetical protein [Roseomonas genomospecies 6]KAA0678261.1 hypothetical protein DS843_20625 [Roseomonas genomospecies 6]